jgi:hypothetical protein
MSSALSAPTPVRPAVAPTRPRRGLYRLLLAWTFAFFNAVRLATYLPTIWAIHLSGRSDQHSLLTWLSWFFANATMALWLYEQSERRLDGATLITIGNAAMCLITAAVICWYR